MISYQELAEVLGEAELRFPVNDWVLQGFRIWPMLRTRIYWEATLPPLFNGKRERIRSRFAAMQRERRTLVKSLYSKFSGGGKHYRDAAPAEVAILSDGFSVVHMDGKYFDRFCDPVDGHFRAQGVSTFKMAPAEPFLPQHSPPMQIGLALRWIRLRASIQNRRSQPVAMGAGYAEFSEFIQSRLGVHISWTTLQRAAYVIEQYSKFFQEALTTLQSKIGFLVSYYNLEGFAFSLACRRLGIPSVDVQHGVQGQYHLAYGGWRNVPVDGYELMPQEFLVWSEEEAAAIRSWTSRVEPSHDVSIGCNMFLGHCQAEHLHAITQITNEVRRSVRPGALQVLYSLSYVDTAEALCQIRSMIAATQNAERPLQWWMRMHPVGRDRLGMVRQIFAEVGVTPDQVNLATHSPLYAILPSMDVHVTKDSSTVIEAESFGVASVATQPTAIELFPSQAAAGTLIYAERTEDVADAIYRQAGLRRPRTEIRSAAKASLQRGYDALYRLLTNARRLPELTRKRIA